MKVFLVHAHPEPQSFCAALRREAEALLPATTSTRNSTRTNENAGPGPVFY